MIRCNQKGGAVIEFAVILPLLVLLICGAIEFGLLVYNKQVITNASREAVRAGITGQSASDVASIATGYCGSRLISLNSIITPDLLSVSITPPDGQNDITVSVSLTYDLLFSRIIGIDHATISGQTVMRMESI